MDGRREAMYRVRCSRLGAYHGGDIICWLCIRLVKSLLRFFVYLWEYQRSVVFKWQIGLEGQAGIPQPQAIITCHHMLFAPTRLRGEVASR